MDGPLGSLTALALLLAVAPAGVVEPEPPPLAGTRVSGSNDPATAPALATGRYRDRLPRDHDLHYRLPRTESASTFHVAVLFIGAGGSVGEGVRTKVGTTPGDQGCGSAGVFRPTVGEPAPLLFTSVSTWTDVTDHVCATSAELFLSVEPPSDPADAGRPFELLVYEEPPLSQYALDLLPTPQPVAWTPIVAADPPRGVRPGTTPTNAPVVADGSYALSLEPGRTEVVAVELDWEQTLHAQLDAVLPARVPDDDQLTVDVISPLLGSSDVVFSGREPADWTPGPGEGLRRYRTGAQSHPVSYLNRDSYDSTVNTESMAGVHYVLVTWLSTGENPLADLRVGATLTLRTSGSAVAGIPSYTQVEGLVPPAAESRLVDGALERAASDEGVTSPSEERGDDASDVPWRTLRRGLALAGGAVLLVVVGLRLRAQLRRGRRSRAGRGGRGGRHRG